MIEDFALWLGCNAMTQDLALCAINTLLILPGLMGMFALVIVYAVLVPYLACFLVMSLIRKIRDK